MSQPQNAENKWVYQTLINKFNIMDLSCETPSRQLIFNRNSVMTLMKKDSDFKSQIKPLFRVFANTNSFYMLIDLKALHNINQFTLHKSFNPG